MGQGLIMCKLKSWRRWFAQCPSSTEIWSILAVLSARVRAVCNMPLSKAENLEQLTHRNLVGSPPSSANQLVWSRQLYPFCQKRDWPTGACAHAHTPRLQVVRGARWNYLPARCLRNETKTANPLRANRNIVSIPAESETTILGINPLLLSLLHDT